MSTHPTQLPYEQKRLWQYTDIDTSPLRLSCAFLHVDYSINLHTHDYFEINFVESGKGLHYFGGRCIPIEQGDVFVVRPGDDHGYVSLDRLNVWHLCIHKAFFSRYYGELELLDGFSLLFEIEPSYRTGNTHYPQFRITDTEQFSVIQQAFARVNLHSYSSRMLDTIFLYSETTMLIARLCSVYYESITATVAKGAPHTDGNEFSLIFSAVDYIHEHYGEDIEIEELYKRSFMSKNKFYEAFKRVMHTTPLDYLNSYRIAVAKKLLLETDKNVTEISMELGFFDSSHFTKIFKRYLNDMTPTDFRKLLRAGK